MKTLAIFGESFASINPSKPTSIHLAWPNQLDSSQWLVTNHAMPATSFYWTYRKFLQHHDQYDQVVCLVASPGRYTKRDNSYVFGIPFSISSIPHATYLLNQTRQQLTYNERKIVESVHDYMMYAQDIEYEIDTHVQLLEHLKRLRPDAIFIPTNPTIPNLCPPDHVMMMDFTRIIIASLNPRMMKKYWTGGSVGGWIPNEERDPIQCHLTPEVNALVAGCVESALTTGIWAPQLPTTVEHSLKWGDYYNSSDWFSINIK
jgi:hypothetical protein